MKTQKLLQILTSAGIAMLLMPVTSIVSAQSADSTNTTVFPYEQTFVISAYYSPLDGQKKYVTGSYKGDLRLNGGGVHGADGSNVYPGMVAAPKNYAFGTKMKVPGVGVVAVHDRGGAIVNAGQRNQTHDRLDIWMGYGDAGLQRALHWGRRTVEVTVYGIDSTVQESVDLEGYSEAEKIAEVATGEEPKTFVQDLSLNDQNGDVNKLQTGLKKLGYYSGDINGDYDDATRDGVVKFQIAVGLIDSSNDFGSGYFGPQTRKALEDALNKSQTEINDHLPQTPLSKDDQGDDVKKLQTALQKLGYTIDVTGVYDDQTVNAILQFQKDQKVVVSENDFGAGVFGPKTMKLLANKLVGVNFDDGNVITASLVSTNNDVVSTANAAAETSVTPVVVFTKDLKLGDKGDDVRRLQEELKRMNYLGIEPSGYYGEVTQHAVLKFQEVQGLIGSPDDNAAGYFGAGTRSRIHSIIGERQQVADLMAQKNPIAKKDEDVALK